MHRHRHNYGKAPSALKLQITHSPSKRIGSSFSRVKRWLETKISYQEVTCRAYPGPPPPGIVNTFTVEYEDGPRKNPEGSMSSSKGKPVNVKNRMIFHVIETG